MRKKAKILLVEDEFILAEELSFNLKAAGYEIAAVVNSGEKALKEVRKSSPDLVLMDINLGRPLDGIQTADRIRSQFGVPVVYTTAFADQETIDRAKASKPFGYLLKPISQKQLASTIEIALSLASLETERLKYEKKLTEALEESERRGSEVASLLEGARSIMDRPDFPSAARGLFDACCQAIGATAGYVALLSDDGEENEVLFLEAGGSACSVDPELPMPIRGLRAEAYHSGLAVYDNNFPESKWWDFMPGGHVRLDNVMFAPINIQGKTVGLLGLANSPDGFDDRKARLATAFGEMAAVSLRESWAKQEREQLISKLQTALAEIKTLQGIVPICSNCKKIRNDDGYWEMVEKYIAARSGARFSHGICPDCAHKLYPEFFDEA